MRALVDAPSPTQPSLWLNYCPNKNAVNLSYAHIEGHTPQISKLTIRQIKRHEPNSLVNINVLLTTWKEVHVSYTVSPPHWINWFHLIMVEQKQDRVNKSRYIIHLP